MAFDSRDHATFPSEYSRPSSDSEVISRLHDDYSSNMHAYNVVAATLRDKLYAPDLPAVILHDSSLCPTLQDLKPTAQEFVNDKGDHYHVNADGQVVSYDYYVDGKKALSFSNLSLGKNSNLCQISEFTDIDGRKWHRIEDGSGANEFEQRGDAWTYTPTKCESPNTFSPITYDLGQMTIGVDGVHFSGSQASIVLEPHI